MSTTFALPTVAEVHADVARRALADPSIAKSTDDRQFLKDLQRDERRYGFKATDRLESICTRSSDPAMRVALSDGLRSRERAVAVAEPDETRLEILETEIEGATNVLQVRRRRHPEDPAVARALYESLTRQEEITRALRECVGRELCPT